MFAGPRKVRNVAVFISGGGSTLQSLLEMHHQFDIKLVISNRKSAAGILKSKRFGKPVLFFSKGQSFDFLTSELKRHNISLIVMAGFMKILPEHFVKDWEGKIINIHPSLLPNYKGLNAAEKSWEENADMGVTIHLATKEMDEGETIFQKKVMTQPKQFSFTQCEIFMRSTEQHLLRELTYRMAL
jgi:phosphoribosylglycinamide formyltransferase-1